MNESLLSRNRGFLALLFTQFFEAANDNAFKVLVTLLVADMALKPELGSRYVSLASALFVIPFLAFSTHAGYLADRYSKRTVMLYCKAFEIFLTSLGFFALAARSLPFLLLILFMMGLHSAFSAPPNTASCPKSSRIKSFPTATASSSSSRSWPSSRARF